MDTAAPFFAEQWTSADGAGFICTSKGALIKVTSDGLSHVDAPGRCETVARSHAGHLLASVKTRGIYELGADWQLRATHPYPSGQGDYWSHLAGDARSVALAISAQPVVDRQHPSGLDMKFTTDAPTSLWIGWGASLAQVRVQ